MEALLQAISVTTKSPQSHGESFTGESYFDFLNNDERGDLSSDRPVLGKTDAWERFCDKADGWAARVVGGEAQACGLLLEHPVELKRWLDMKVERSEGEGGLMPDSTVNMYGYHAGTRRKERFLERGLPSDEEALVAQYAALGTKSGRADFKSDVQGIERAILGGAVKALREMVERSPMALWAMDFSLSEYEAENVLAFAAKYAPTGPDHEIIAYLRALGAKLPSESLNLVVGEVMSKAVGIWRKSPKEVACAFEAAGHVFKAADGFALLQRGSMERELGVGMLSVAKQKVEWLLEMEARGVEWTDKLSPSECCALVGALPDDPCKPDRAQEFASHAQAEDGVGLGAWLGMSAAPLRDVNFWSEMGPFLADRGLAMQALRAAKRSGAQVTWELILPYAESEDLATIVKEALDQSSRPRPLRI
jgi:hypothetical protein